MKDVLFEPIKIGNLEIPNRIFMPAMHMNMARNFEVTDQLVDFYAERARGGAGMITVGYATVDEMSGTVANIGAHKDEFIPGLARLAGVVKEKYSDKELHSLPVPPFVIALLEPWLNDGPYIGAANIARDDEESVRTKVHEF